MSSLETFLPPIALPLVRAVPGLRGSCRGCRPGSRIATDGHRCHLAVAMREQGLQELQLPASVTKLAASIFASSFTSCSWLMPCSLAASICSLVGTGSTVGGVSGV